MLKLRDKALKLVQSKGKLSPLLTGKRVLFKTLTYQSGYLQIHYRSPFGPLPDDAEIAPTGWMCIGQRKYSSSNGTKHGEVRIVGSGGVSGKASLSRSHREGDIVTV